MACFKSIAGAAPNAAEDQYAKGPELRLRAFFVVRARLILYSISMAPAPTPSPFPSPSASAQSGRWRRALTPTLFAGFGAIVFILIATLAVGLMHLRQVHATSEAVAHTYSVKLALQQLLTRLVDAETGERGYIITNEAGYLQPYYGARQSVLRDIARFATLSGRARARCGSRAFVAWRSI